MLTSSSALATTAKREASDAIGWYSTMTLPRDEARDDQGLNGCRTSTGISGATASLYASIRVAHLEGDWPSQGSTSTASLTEYQLTSAAAFDK